MDGRLPMEFEEYCPWFCLVDSMGSFGHEGVVKEERFEAE